MKVLVTGAQGFVSQNLILRLKELKQYEILTFTRDQKTEDLSGLVAQADFVFHLAGVNRPPNPQDFETGNLNLTQSLVAAIQKVGRSVPVVFSSSTQAELDNPYGISKRNAEEALLQLSGQHPIYIYRLPNIFGKWCKPNYNSAVATFSYNIINDLPITINDPNAKINLVYIDDVVDAFIQNLRDQTDKKQLNPVVQQNVFPVYNMTVGDLARKLKEYKQSRETMLTEAVGEGLDRALYSTFISYYRPDQFGYSLKRHADARGVFVEFLKTKDSGQFSFFTAGVGITRGGHYHHTKTEKFLILQGQARFKFRNLQTDERAEIIVNAEQSRVIETIPGWVHDISNTGDQELIVMLWACEIFNREKPDTIGSEV